MHFTFATCLSALAALASAYTPANTAQPPSGNPIGHPELGELIPAGQTFTITWSPTTGDRITLLLLRGPSTNVVPIMTIAENIPNTGSYIWGNVPSTLQPDTTGYGIQLIVEGSGEYQYSPQCGVKNDAYTTSVSTMNSGSTTVTVVSASVTSSSSSFSSIGSASSSSSNAVVATSSSPATTPVTSYVTYATAVPSAAGTAGNFSVPVLSPTNSMSVPATLQTTKTKSPSSTVAVPTAVSTGGAAKNVVVGGGAAALLFGVVGFLI